MRLVFERMKVVVEPSGAVGVAAALAPAFAQDERWRGLRRVGVVLCGGSDGVRDGWSPHGNADMLERAMFIGLRNNFRKDEDIALAFDACSYGGAQVMGLVDHGVAVGCRADLLVVPGATIADAVVSPAAPVSATATAGRPANTAPTPNRTASAPTRPTWLAERLLLTCLI
jgi:cytosine/adenosine deaminase-related metal-dependent hydrolase